MDPHLFEAAAEGNIEPFKKLKAEHLQPEQILTQVFKDTILHVHIKSTKKKEKQKKELFDDNEIMISTEFAEQILDICPSLLLQVNAKGDTPLHVAAKCGHSAIAELLIRRAKAKREEANLESGLRLELEMLKMTNNENNTALHEAVRHGRLNVVKILTKEGDRDFSYYANNSGQTPLYLAAARRDGGEMVRAILESCTSAAHQGPNGKTALHSAVMYGNSVKMILKKKKSLTKETDEHGWTPLHYAAYYGRKLSARLLLKNDKSAAYIGDKDRKMTALHMAGSQGHLGTIKTIISYCPECYELVDNRGWNVLHFAMLGLSPKQRRALLLQKPLVRSLINEKDDKGNTPLHVLAADYSSYPLPFKYYKYGGDLTAVNEKNVSVEYISNYGNPELKKEIQELSKDVGKEQQYPLGVIRKRRDDSTEKDEFKQTKTKNILKDTRASHLAAATLIATVTFAATFTSSGGYKSDQGTAILRRNSAFQVFIITDTIAMTLSLSAVFIHLFMCYKPLQKSKGLFMKLFLATLYLTIFAMGAMVVAFVTGVYAVLAPSLWLASTTCVIGLIFFLLVFWAMKQVARSESRNEM